MPNICFYFQVHQPYRLAHYSVFDIGNSSHYFNHEKNNHILRKVSSKCYIKTNDVLFHLLKKHPEFKVSFSLSGVVLDQFAAHCPETLKSFKKLFATGKVELLAETYYHSLAFLYSEKEFEEQVRFHSNKIKKLFGTKPTILRNTELIYDNDFAQKAAQMGFKGVLVEGADKILGWRSPNFIYKPKNVNIKLLLKNYRLSDDIAFRFSDRSWKHWPLNVETYTQWINNINGNGITVNLFMDYETFGEHQWESTGIFEFLKHLPGKLLEHPDNTFKLPSEIIDSYEPVGELDVPHTISWADTERDLSAWIGNDMQKCAIKTLYNMENAIKKTNNRQLIKDWRLLQTSDHFYYMCTKWFNDGDVHKYFNPYDSPYEAFIYFMNVCKDLQRRIKQPTSASAHASDVTQNQGTP